MDHFNPNSVNAMLGRIDEHLKAQDTAAKIHSDTMQGKLYLIETAVNKTNGRVTVLEAERWRQRGIVAAISFGITFLAWLLPLVIQIFRKS